MKKIKLIIIILSVMVSWLWLGASDDEGLHDTWDKLLKDNVSKGLVSYKSFGRRQHLLNGYLEKLGTTDLSGFNREQKLAFWINAYNAFTVKLILKHYPVKSIRKISRPWKQRIWKAAGKTVSLDEIEHKILRKELKEPRIHFAIVCASIGCPDLQPFAFRSGLLQKQLDDSARHFFASSKHFKIKEAGEKVIIYISKIFSWFGEDFGDNKKEKADFIQRYVDKTTADKLKKAKSFKFKYLGYDWNLNERD
ncbi:MAG: DUF547 domain-containing protein [bacterium]|nr:DUF547 domain-containing protein [bacterium]